VGQSDPQQSGRALLALQSQTDTGTFHFPDNLALSVRHGGRILIDLVPKIYDTPRVLRIMGEDGEVSTAQIDPNQEHASAEHTDMLGNVKNIYNLGVGKYDVTATVGPSYATKRMEQSEMMLQIMQAQPELMATIGDLLFKSFDWPMADKIAERLKKQLPPQLQDAEEGQQEIPAQVQAAIAQIQQQNQQLDQKAQALSQAEQEIDKKAMDVQRKSVEVYVKESQLQAEAARVDLEKYANELAAKEQAMNQGNGEGLEVWKAKLDADVKLKIAELKSETDLALGMLSKEPVDGADGMGNENGEVRALIDTLNQNISSLMDTHAQLTQQMMDSHNAASQNVINAVSKPRTTEATAVKQPDGTWKLTKKEV
jgi:hypothetical protein